MDPLLLAILETSDDDLPRLAYADRCEESDQSDRAEFIRVQLELARLLDEGHQPSPQLQDRERELLNQHRQAWTAPLWNVFPHAPIGSPLRLIASPAWRRWVFRRGFIETIRPLSAEEFLAYAEAIYLLAPVRCVTLMEAEDEITHLAACPCLAWVTDLSISPQVRFSASRLPTMSNQGSLSADDLSTLLSSPHLFRLRSLGLAGWRLGVEGVEMLLAWDGAERLRELDLGSTGIGDTGLAALAASPRLRYLVDLRLGENQITAAGVAAPLAESTLLPRLRTLALGFNDIGAEGAQVLAGSPALRTLVELELNWCYLTDLGAEALVVSQNLGGIRQLAILEGPDNITELGEGRLMERFGERLVQTLSNLIPSA